MGRRFALLAMLMLLARSIVISGGPLFSQEEKPGVALSVVAMKELLVRDETGQERVRLKEVFTTGPGDTLVYRIAYTNRGDAPVTGARILDPIPAGTQLVPGSWQADGAEFSVSVDGGASFESYPVRRSVKRADGSTVQREVEASTYTHVRWITKEPLAPGATRLALFKVQVR